MRRINRHARCVPKFAAFVKSGFVVSYETMLQRWVNFLKNPPPGETPQSGTKPQSGVSEGDFAAICLLVSAAYIEDGCDERELAALRRLAVEGFGIEPSAIDELLELAAATEREASDLFRWTKRVNEAYDHERKCALLEQMWQVVMSDGIIGDFESNLLRRAAGLLYIPDREAGEARRRAAHRMQPLTSPTSEPTP